jgi:hypothetical protein
VELLAILDAFFGGFGELFAVAGLVLLGGQVGVLFGLDFVVMHHSMGDGEAADGQQSCYSRNGQNLREFHIQNDTAGAWAGGEIFLHLAW